MKELEDILHSYTFTSSSGQIVFWNDHIHTMEGFKAKISALIKKKETEARIDELENAKKLLPRAKNYYNSHDVAHATGEILIDINKRIKELNSNTTQEDKA